MTAPSIIIPKSIAPRLIKLASIPKYSLMKFANNKHNGITDATNQARTPITKQQHNDKITIKHPKIRFSATVKWSSN
jgi:hypothetical protein